MTVCRSYQARANARAADPESAKYTSNQSHPLTTQKKKKKNNFTCNL